ncbi:hypothetical protein [Aquibacillus saliphilus]|uniref:hypothetical protein n=1 Tax=Aquibacillus saliphilus TaxID=1909422 RepID=UPI001CF04E7F|nr:hypothetical protein [Aquibacillus saliphilus]
MSKFNCIYREHTINYNTLSDSRLIGESKEGERAPLLQEQLTLTIADGRYRLTNGRNGEVLRQGLSDGTPESIFGIYDSASLVLPNLRVVTADFEGSFDQYEFKHGHGRIERTKLIKYFAFTETTDTDTVIGITQKAGNGTGAIYSTYFDYPLNRREKAQAIATFLLPKLKPNERATVTAVGVTPDQVNIKYQGVLRIYNDGYEDKHEEARLLAEEAAEHKESTSEVFDEAMYYQIEGLYSKEVNA